MPPSTTYKETMASKVEFSRGDGVTHTFSIPATNWTAGGTLFFAAKPAIDDDTSDAAAVISASFTDSVVTNTTINGIAYKQYTCYFPPSATYGILSNGVSKADYVAEFQYVPTTGIPVTFPATDKKLDAVVYFDVKRKTTV